MITVNNLIEKLQELKDKGYGEFFKLILIIK